MVRLAFFSNQFHLITFGREEATEEQSYLIHYQLQLIPIKRWSGSNGAVLRSDSQLSSDHYVTLIPPQQLGVRVTASVP